jgi:hypothetical protein
MTTIAAFASKGQIFTAENGSKYVVIQKKAQHLGNGEFVVMVRPEAGGRAFDLFYGADSIAKGAANGGYDLS